MRTPLLAACALVIGGAPALAQGPTRNCADTLTLVQCWDLVSGVAAFTLQDTAAARASRETDHQLQAKTTGVPAVAPGIASAISDFLPLLAGGVGVATTSNPDGSLTLETNLPLPIGVRPQRARLRGILHHARLFDALDQALPADTREATRTALEHDFGDFDDVELSLAFNLETGRFGRSFGAYSDLYGTLFQQAWTATELDLAPVKERDKLIAFTRALRSLESEEGPCGRADETVPVRCLTPNGRASLIEAAEAGRAVDQALGERMRTGGLFRLASMINNQPQLNLEGSARLRHGFVGPDEYSVTGRFELGFVNVNSYRGFCRRQQRDINLDCLETYLRRPGVRQSLDHGDRLWLSASWISRRDFAAVLPAQAVNFTLAGSSTLDLNAGLGRYVAVNGQGIETGRVDVSFEYQANDNSTLRNDRLIASASYTHRVNDTMSLLVGFVYANKPEFITDVDRKVSGNIGLRYQLQSPTPSQ